MNATRPMFLGLALAALGLSACNETKLMTAPTSRMDPATLASVRGQATSLVGSWHGTVSLEQGIGGEKRQTNVDTELGFQADALPNRLPALGFIGAWRNYAPTQHELGVTGVGTRLSDGHAGTVFVYCVGEADGGANELALDPISAIATTSTFAWRYGADYPFADLLNYRLYDYLGGPTASMQASESYALEGDRLHIEASARGTDSSGRDIALQVSGVLDRGENQSNLACKLGN